MDVRVFIISWAGKHENAAAIARDLDGMRDRLAIVYSDPDPDVGPSADCSMIRRPNELFYSDKFLACLDHGDADLTLVLHADCSCTDWQGLVDKCLAAFRTVPKLGVGLRACGDAISRSNTRASCG